MPSITQEICSNGPIGAESSAYRVVVAGASYGGLMAAVNLLALADGKEIKAGMVPAPPLDRLLKKPLEIILIDERDGFLHTIGTPLCQTARPFVTPFWKQLKSFKELRRKEVKIVQGSVSSIDLEARKLIYTKSGNVSEQITQHYDFAILATGLRREYPIVPQSLSREDYVKEASAHIDGIEKAPGGSVVVIGGGAVGIEFAGEIKNYHPDQKVTLIHSRGELLSNEPLPVEFKDRTLAVLLEEGVEVSLNQRPVLREVDGETTLTFSDGTVIKPSFVVKATSKWVPSTKYLPPEVLDEEGYVKVKPNLALQKESSPRHFVVGDIARVAGIKRAGAAMAMGRMAAVNLYSYLLSQEDPSREEQLIGWPDMPPMIALAVGKQAVTYVPVQGVKYGVEAMQLNFGSDLAWERSLIYMGLTELGNIE